jgi:hypothetical protein
VFNLDVLNSILINEELVDFLDKFLVPCSGVHEAIVAERTQ